MKYARNRFTEMTKRMRLLPIFLIAVAALILGVSAPMVWAGNDELDVAEIFFELNDTDGDLGIHALIDGEPWDELEIEDKYGRGMLDIGVRGRLKQQGLTEIFFESAEPSFDDLLPERFFERFPRGRYEVEVETLEGDELESEVKVTHVMPAPADGITVNGIPISSGCPVDGDGEDNPPVVGAPGDPVVISWDQVGESHEDIGYPNGWNGIKVIRYQLVVEFEDDDEVAWVFSTDLQKPDEDDARLMVTVPPEFIALSDEFKFEILVREESYNQTAVESCFKLEEEE